MNVKKLAIGAAAGLGMSLAVAGLVTANRQAFNALSENNSKLPILPESALTEKEWAARCTPSPFDGMNPEHIVVRDKNGLAHRLVCPQRFKR